MKVAQDQQKWNMIHPVVGGERLYMTLINLCFGFLVKYHDT